MVLFPIKKSLSLPCTLCLANTILLPNKIVATALQTWPGGVVLFPIKKNPVVIGACAWLIKEGLDSPFTSSTINKFNERETYIKGRCLAMQMNFWYLAPRYEISAQWAHWHRCGFVHLMPFFSQMTNFTHKYYIILWPCFELCFFRHCSFVLFYPFFSSRPWITKTIYRFYDVFDVMLSICN